MKRDLMEILCCPICKGDLELRVDVEKDEILEGSLFCKHCNHRYEIKDGIPDLLPPDFKWPRGAPIRLGATQDRWAVFGESVCRCLAQWPVPICNPNRLIREVLVEPDGHRTTEPQMRKRDIEGRLGDNA